MKQKPSVRNKCEFNEDWDKLLTLLLEQKQMYLNSNGLLLDIEVHTKEVSYFFGFFKRQEYTKYSVWLGNKNSHYGSLYAIDDKYTCQDHSPLQSTLDKLFEIEKGLKFPNCYGLPKGLQ